MNRHFIGTFALLWATTLAGLATAQTYPMPYPPQAYTAQNAVYYASPGQGTGVSHAAMQQAIPPGMHPGMYAGAYPPAGAMPPGGVQLASCDAACDAGGCDAMGCSPFGGCSTGDCCGGGMCGLFKGLCGGGCGHGFDGCNCQMLSDCFGKGCCLPRWFDVAGEWLFWQRDYEGSGQFSSQPNLGANVLDAGQLDFSEESGFRLTGAYLVHPATALELSYFGGFNWSASATATGASDLFSVFSDFGGSAFNGTADTGFANLHSLAMSSELDNLELNLRQRFVSSNCIFHSSALVGVRYVRFREDLLFHTETNTGGLDYHVKADNDLVGVQIGGDSYLCVSSRFKFGGEIKAGVYGTANKQRTRVDSVNTVSLRESIRDNDVAFVGEAGLTGLFRLTSRSTLRLGYQVLFVDGVATALDNFNATTPFATRPAILDNDGDVFFHGAKLGVEFAF